MVFVPQDCDYRKCKNFEEHEVGQGIYQTPSSQSVRLETRHDGCCSRSFDGIKDKRYGRTEKRTNNFTIGRWSSSIKTITGWVSRKGHFFGDDEQSPTRYDGSTHLKCPTCGKIINKHEYCYECHTKAEIEKYQKMKRKKWNEIDGIYSYTRTKWFWSYEELDDYIMDNNTTVDDLLLILKTPACLRQRNRPVWLLRRIFRTKNKEICQKIYCQRLMT